MCVLTQLSQIANHVATGIGDNTMGFNDSAAGMIGEDGNGLWTDAVLLVQTLHINEEKILGPTQGFSSSLLLPPFLLR
jgi:hypothetical protein